MSVITADLHADGEAMVVGTATVLRRPLMISAGALSIAAGIIHGAVTFEHLQEYLLFGLFFAVVAALQVGWGMVVAAGAGRRLVVAGIACNLGLLVLWAVSRTAGLPFGPHHGAEAVAVPDVVCAVVEVLTIIGAVGLLLPVLRDRGISRRSASLGIGAVAVAVAAMLVLSLPGAFGGESEHEGPAHEAGGAQLPAVPGAGQMPAMPGMP